jgi:hypothetical protein
MKHWLITLLALASHAQVADEWIGFVGFGPIVVGTRAADVTALLNRVPDARDADPEGCDQVALARVPSLTVMVVGGVIVRVETKDASLRTWSGVRVGDSEAKALKRYAGRVEVTGHRYVDGGHYLTVRSAGRRHALVLETDGKTVTSVRAGLVPAAEYVEGCS